MDIFLFKTHLSVDILQQYYTVIDKYLQGGFIDKYRKISSVAKCGKIAYNVKSTENFRAL